MQRWSIRREVCDKLAKRTSLDCRIDVRFHRDCAKVRCELAFLHAVTVVDDRPYVPTTALVVLTIVAVLLLQCSGECRHFESLEKGGFAW